MRVKNLKLINFRNYDELDLSFEKGVQVIQGANGSGKTSLVESIGYLPLCKSIRTNEDKELIKIGREFAKIEVLLESKRNYDIKIVISQKGKRIEVDDVEQKKVSDIAGLCKVVSFLPKDVELFKEVPLKRRKFIDSNLSMVDKVYLKTLSEYNHLLNELRTLIKQQEYDLVLVKTLMESLAKRGKLIQTKREEFVQVLNGLLKEFAKYLEDEETTIELIYHPDIKKDDSDYIQKCLKKLEDNLLHSNGRVVIPGIHLDDISMNFRNKDIAIFGSQGQNRISVIALKLSLFKWISRKFDEEPIVILDDVLSELDN